MLSLTDNTSYEERNYSYIEPVPDWSATLERVGRGIYVFNIFGVCFLTIHVACIVLISRICKRLGNQQLHLIQTVTIAVNVMCLGLCLTIDPYSRSKNMSVFMNNLLEQIADPCIIAAFFTLQNFLIKVASIRVSWNKLQTTGRIVTVLVLYIINLIILEAIICYNYKHLKSLRLLSKFEFVIFSVYSCLCYLCTGFKAAMYLDYMKSPSKMSDQILLDHPSDTETDSRCLITSPRTPNTGTNNNVKTKLNMSSTRTLYTSTDSTEEEEGRNKLQNSKKPRRRQKKQNNKKMFSKHFNSNIKLKSLHVNKVFHDSKVDLPLIKDDTSTALEINHDRPTHSNHSKLPTGNIISNETNSSSSSTSKSQTNVEQDKHNETCKLEIYSDKSASKSDHENTNENVPLNISETTQTTGKTGNGTMVISHTDSFLDMESDSSCSDSLEDNGYLADGENINAIPGAGPSSIDGDSIYSQFKQNNFDSVTQKGDFPSICSLIRIRQCAMLQKLITVAYFVTFAVVVNTIFHMYSIFGVYGIFGTHRAPKPWPWFLFQLLHRIIEVSLAVSQMVSIVIVLNSKPRKRKQRFRQNP